MCYNIKSQLTLSLLEFHSHLLKLLVRHLCDQLYYILMIQDIRDACDFMALLICLREYVSLARGCLVLLREVRKLGNGWLAAA